MNNHLNVEIQINQLTEYFEDRDFPNPNYILDIDQYITSNADVHNLVNVVIKNGIKKTELEYTNYHIEFLGLNEANPLPNINGVLIDVMNVYGEEVEYDAAQVPSKEKYFTMYLRMTSTRNQKTYEVGIRMKSLKNYTYDEMNQINENKGVFEGSLNQLTNVLSGTEAPTELIGRDEDLYIKYTE